MPKLKELALFGVAGTAGFLIDSAVLYLLKGTLGLYGARASSFLCAVIGTWLINRRLTFRHSPSNLSLHKEFAKYLIMMLLGGTANYAVYALSVYANSTVHEHPVIGVALGSLAGMVINYAQMKFLLFKAKFPPEHKQE